MPVICFASPKGGVGKTMLAANLAGTLAQAGRRVVALDLDPQNALRLHFGMPLANPAGFTCGLSAAADWHASLLPTMSGVSLLAYGEADTAAALRLAAAVERDPMLILRPLWEMLADPDTLVVVDTAPGASTLFSTILPYADLVVTVLAVEAGSVAQLPRLSSGAMYGEGIDLTRPTNPARDQFCFVLNQLDARTQLGQVLALAARQHLGDWLLGTIRHDKLVMEAIAAQRLLADYAPASPGGLPCDALADVAALAVALDARVRARPRRLPPQPTVPVPTPPAGLRAAGLRVPVPPLASGLGPRFAHWMARLRRRA